MSGSVVFCSPYNSGIGQVSRKYAEILKSDTVEYGEPLKKRYTLGFAYVLPLDSIIEYMKYASTFCDTMIYYTICETEPVNDDYSKLFVLSDTFYTASDFCMQVFSKQFPHIQWKILHNYAKSPIQNIKNSIFNFGDKYVFYHIGNIRDHRKNIKNIIECFYRAQVPNSLLVLKATCNADVSMNLPNVLVIQDFLNDEQLEDLHSKCHCYVSLSHSEGAGMGAVEAALRNKPVIIQEYGGTKEYIHTPYIVPCTITSVGVDDFLFKKEHMWGLPDNQKCIEYMKIIGNSNITHVDHSFTKTLMKNIENKMLEFINVRPGECISSSSREEKGYC